MPSGSGELTLGTSPLRQLTRFGIVGVGVNFVLYLGYLAATGLGLGHKSSMTVFYAVGVALSFTLNRRWTFAHRGRGTSSFFRYLVTYAGCYFLNLSLLWVFVDLEGLPHAYVQGVLVFVVAACTFMAQKHWVFYAR